MVKPALPFAAEPEGGTIGEDVRDLLRRLDRRRSVSLFLRLVYRGLTLTFGALAFRSR